VGDQTADHPQRGDDAYVQWALGVLADQARSEGAAGDESWLRLAIQDASTLAAIRSAHTEFESTHDLHELARAVGNILNGTDDTHG